MAELTYRRTHLNCCLTVGDSKTVLFRLVIEPVADKIENNLQSRPRALRPKKLSPISDISGACVLKFDTLLPSHRGFPPALPKNRWEKFTTILIIYNYMHELNIRRIKFALYVVEVQLNDSRPS